MNKIRTNTVLLLAALTAVHLTASAADSTNTDAALAKDSVAKPLELFANDIVAKGDDVKVTRAMLDEAMINIKASAAARGQTIPPQRMTALESQVLDRLIGMQLLNKMATAADRTNGLESAQKQFSLIKTNAGTEENLLRQLKTVGMTVEELNKKLQEEAVADAVLQREIKFDVSDADVKKFYDDNPSQFEQPETVRAAHILISTQEKDGSEMSDAKKAEKKKLAEGLLKRAKAGEDFAKLAQEYSDDPGSKDRGGEYTFPRGQMVPEFEAAAFGMETNQISDLVTTQFGYHIIKLLEKHPAKTVSFEEAAPDIRKYLKTRGIQQQIPAFMAKLEKDAHVEILDPDLKQAAADRAKALAEQQADAAAKPPGAGEQKTDGQK